MTFSEWLAGDRSRLHQVASLCKTCSRNVHKWRYKMPLPRAKQLVALTGLSVEELLQRAPKPAPQPYAGLRSGIPIIDGQSPKHKELWSVRTQNIPTNLDNKLMGTPPNGRSVWDQTKAVRGPDGRLLDEIPPLNVSDIFAGIKNIPRNESRTEQASLLS